MSLINNKNIRRKCVLFSILNKLIFFKEIIITFKNVIWFNHIFNDVTGVNQIALDDVELIEPHHVQ